MTSSFKFLLKSEFRIPLSDLIWEGESFWWWNWDHVTQINIIRRYWINGRKRSKETNSHRFRKSKAPSGEKSNFDSAPLNRLRKYIFTKRWEESNFKKIWNSLLYILKKGLYFIFWPLCMHAPLVYHCTGFYSVLVSYAICQLLLHYFL